MSAAIEVPEEGLPTAPSVLVLSASYPLPADIGRKVVLLGLLRHLWRRFGPEKVLLVHLDPAPEGSTRPPLPCRSLALPLAPAPFRLLRMGSESLLLRRRPLQQSALLSRAARGKLAALLAQPGLRLVVADTLRVAPYLEGFAPAGVTRVLYLDDLYSERYRGLLETKRLHPEAELGALGTFARFLPSWAARLGRIPALETALLRLEQRLMERAETAAVSSFHRALLLNGEEARLLAERAPEAEVMTIPPLIASEARHAPQRRPSPRPTFLFLGSLDYPPNRFALARLLESARRDLLQRLPEARLLVVGTGKPGKLATLAAPWGEAVSFLGFVPSLAPLMAEATAMIAPLLYGSGVKLKVIEALAAGLPLVATPCGAEGIALADGREGFIRERLEDFPAAMAALTDPEHNASCSAAAFAHYRRIYGPEAVASAYEAAFAPPEGSETLVRLGSAHPAFVQGDQHFR